ncbi:hypothetical protein [Methylosinus sp. Ce-a6]|uniref:hypothetical protein n=1 Tax=Methylosinus sp. Ce-a6 TaxID=2172005 RepID=UPI001FCE4D04|nr:hypothetical protein [Methylosinus sp. Ce-a6]
MSSGRAPTATRFREALEGFEAYGVMTLKSVTTWGRYGEIFACDEGAPVFSLENPR